MIEDSAELAGELAERFSVATVDGGQADSDAIAYLLTRYPLTDETAAGWRAFLDGVSDSRGALPIEAGAAAELRRLLVPFCNAEKEEAQPDAGALAQYIDAGFTLYAQAETPAGRTFVDWRTGKWGRQPRSVIRTLDELGAALNAGIRLFSFLPSERGFVCIDVDRGHSSGKDGFKSIERFLKRLGLAVNPFEIAVVTVDTPSGGKHLYFRDWTSATSKYDKEPLKGVEVFGKGVGTTLTTAGSVKKGKVYKLHGRLEDATNLPNALVDHIREKRGGGANRYPQYPTKSGYSHTSKKNRGEYPLEQLVEWGIENANSDSRHINAFYVGLSVGSAYPLSEVKAACYRNGKFADRRGFSDSELEYQLNRGIAKSGYK